MLAEMTFGEAPPRLPGMNNVGPDAAWSERPRPAHLANLETGVPLVTGFAWTLTTTLPSESLAVVDASPTREGRGARNDERNFSSISTQSRTQDRRFRARAARLLLSCLLPGFSSASDCADFPRPTVAAAPIAERIDELRQLP